MTEFVLGPYRMEVDVESTRAWYSRYGDASAGCDCLYCKNFAAAVGTLSPEIGKFLEPLGLDLQKPGDASECGPAEGGRLYLPIYHLVGRLLEGEDEPLELIPGVSVWFATNTGPFLQDFPEPSFQCCFSMTLPWMLEEQP